MTATSPKHAITLAALLALTVATAVIAGSAHISHIVLGLSFVKIQLVAFRFMDLRHAHLFWKAGFVFFSLSLLSALALLSAN